MEITTTSERQSFDNNEAWDRDFHRIWRGSKIALDCAMRVLRIAEMPPRARCALLALSTILRAGEARYITRAALAARLDKDEKTAGRYIDSLVDYQAASGLTFIEIDRCDTNERKPAFFADQWDALLIEAIKAAMKNGAPLDKWVKGGGSAQPADRAREDVAAAVFELLPRKEPIMKTKPPQTEDQIRDLARRRAEQLGPKLKEIFADLEEIAHIDAIIARVEFERLTHKVLPKSQSKADRRIQDEWFRQMGTVPPREDSNLIGQNALVGPDSLHDMVKIGTVFDHHYKTPENANSNLIGQNALVAFQNKEVTGAPELNSNLIGQNALVTPFGVEPESEDWDNFPEPPEDAARLAAALAYAEQGRKLIPVHGLTPDGLCRCYKGKDCRSPGKHPAVVDWVNKASCDPAQIEDWLTARPGSNVGWAMGGGFLALDFDGPEGAELYQVLQDTFDFSTLEQRTGGGGIQAIFSEAPDLSNSVRPHPGLDLRSQGGMIVIAPSFSGKGPYTWRTGPQEPTPLPAALLEWIKAQIEEQKKPKSPPLSVSPGAHPQTAYGSSISLPAIPEGQRNRTVYSYLCGRRNSIGEVSTIREIAYRVNLEYCNPPMPESEIEEIIKQVCKHQPSTTQT